MAIRITFGDTQAGRKFKRGIKRQSDRVREATRGTAHEMARLILERGRRDIARAGNFGSRWIEGFKAVVNEGGGFTRIRVTHDVPYWTVFQTGKKIDGKPLLWIPLSFADDAIGLRARDYPGPLFRVDREGKAPLLLTTGGEPKYFGKESIRIPKKFHLLEIAAEVSRRAGDIYKKHFKRAGR